MVLRVGPPNRLPQRPTLPMIFTTDAAITITKEPITAKEPVRLVFNLAICTLVLSLMYPSRLSCQMARH